MQVNKDTLHSRLAEFGQEHVLRFWDELSAVQRQALVAQLEVIDFPLLRRLTESEEEDVDWEAMASRAAPPAAFRLHEQHPRFTRAEAQTAAEALLSAGKLGAILVAGGQGSRLGFPHPKGMYRIGPVSNRSLFQIFFDQLRAVANRFRTRIPLFLMTSPATHDETLAYLRQHDCFGFSNRDLHVFCQGTMPAVDDQGRILMEAKGQVFQSPDGHGGMLAALNQSGGLKQARELGLEQFFYFQVDNPLLEICDRQLVGFHALANSDMSTLVVAKQSPLDKVGNVVDVDGRLRVIEYSDFPESVAQQRDAEGGLRFWAGSIAVHVFRVDFLERMAAAADSLPFHRARKKVPYIDHDGNSISPEEPNATKFERFIFDLMPAARNAIVVEGQEQEVFAPLKNASGEPKDTPETTRAALAAKYRRWFEAAGGNVAEPAMLEISPDVALDADELGDKIEPGRRITEDTYLQSTSE